MNDYSLLLLHHSFAHEYLPQTLLQKVVKVHETAHHSKFHQSPLFFSDIECFRLPESYGTLQRDAPPVQLLPHNPEPPATTTATGDATAFPEQPKQHNVGLVQAAKQHFHCQKEVKKLN
ncbi:unnamed protein product [Thlaspi arvense]|uniref:Uncharacterized protein n=1 Tax=Thlaspi arvense TaxID=13288 RepID=A0AAU9SGC2_THLAR|nr:unnamed protein product [Thlaspi arvense]